MIEVGATTGNQGKITPSFASAIGPDLILRLGL